MLVKDDCAVLSVPNDADCVKLLVTEDCISTVLIAWLLRLAIFSNAALVALFTDGVVAIDAETSSRATPAF